MSSEFSMYDLGPEAKKLAYLAGLWDHEAPTRAHVRRVIRESLKELGLWEEFKVLLIVCRSLME